MRRLYLLIIFPINLFYLAGCSNSNNLGQLLTPSYLDSTTNELYEDETVALSANSYGFAPDEIVLYNDSIYALRYEDLSSEIPMEFNEYVKDYIEMYADREKALTERMISKSKLYFPHIEKVLDSKDMPMVLKNLAMVESALNPEAESRRYALGLWQLTFPTATSQGLRINDYVDERMDPILSTEAATTYLTELHSIYHDWLLAIAAYNCGPGNVNKAITRMGGYTDFWSLYPYLPRETRGYVPAFMAITYLLQHQQEHNIRPEALQLSFNAFDSTRVFEPTTLEAIASSTHTSVDEIRYLNPAVLSEIVPGDRRGIVINLPVNKLATFEANKKILSNDEWKDDVVASAIISKVIKPKVPKDSTLILIHHRIRPGNTLTYLAKRYKCTVRDIMDWNGMREPVIRYGESLKIFVPKGKAG